MSRNIATKVTDMMADWARKDADAQTEAVTRLGLPKNNTAKDRAKAMGFSDETYYHGTNKSFDEFKFNESNGAGGIGGESVWFTGSPNIANSYADYIAKKGLLPKENIPLNEYISANNKLNNTIGQASQVYPVKIRKGQSNSYDMAGESYKDSDGFISEYMDGKIEKAKAFKDDTTVFTDLDDHMQHGATIPPSTHIAVNNLANIRSPLAHFNPKYAGIGGAGAILSNNLMANELDLEFKGHEPSIWDSLMNTVGGVNQQQAQAYGNTGAGTMGGAANLAGMLATDPAVAAEVIGTVGLKGMSAVSPYIKGFGLGLLLDASELGAAEIPKEEFEAKLRDAQARGYGKPIENTFDGSGNLIPATAERPGLFEELQKKRVR